MAISGPFIAGSIHKEVKQWFNYLKKIVKIASTFLLLWQPRQSQSVMPGEESAEQGSP
jgi:hypothetical protein